MYKANISNDNLGLIYLSTRFLYSLIFAVFIFYFNFLYESDFTYHKPIPDHFPAVFRGMYIFLLIIFSFDSIIQFYKIKNNKRSFEWHITRWEIVFLMVGVFALVLVLFKNAIYTGVWSDENYQYARSFLSPINETSVQHQMPLSYIQTFIADTIFSSHLIAIKFFSLINSICLIILIFLGLTNITKSYVPRLIFVIFFFTSFMLLRHSVEGRPLSLAMLFSCIFLYKFYFVFLSFLL